MIKYFITDPNYSLDLIKKAIFIHRPDFVCYRNKKYYSKEEIIAFAKFANRYSKTIIHIDSLKENSLLEFFDGIHFSSSKIDLISRYKNLTTIASTHTIQEVKKAKQADFITFSPIFKSKGREGLGTDVIEEVYKHHKKIIALGGIVSEKEVGEIEKTKAVGFASIRYFLHNFM